MLLETTTFYLLSANFPFSICFFVLFSFRISVSISFTTSLNFLLFTSIVSSSKSLFQFSLPPLYSLSSSTCPPIVHITLYFLFELLHYYYNLHLFLPRFPPNSFRSFFLFLLLMLSPPISFSFFHGFNFCVLSFVFSHSLSYSFSTPIPFSTSPQAWQVRSPNCEANFVVVWMVLVVGGGDGG